MEYVNSIAKIVHTCVATHGGAANKNIGDAFLLVSPRSLQAPRPACLEPYSKGRPFWPQHTVNAHNMMLNA